ncbi:hypothetical protein P153DRAFT_375184 [Dothidotthia symphoricarpi CBS 119687]|uniref:RING-type domain-containing protein n=1 Tax=Dothidotthia symphoricarpi CBS 119687 TaxID=1392245 RepID=A0A6A6AFT7_9PLEO|nr:uncharacterized protein P153DRAFT_375184 [Dothidotthia symphoricarpi CBS 119687]KAF2130426.1 hypothetical protein P153DRAFT_375184 [Dothidotthia symphoricarpi CBS 119687]
MTVFASKEALTSLGLEHLQPSHAHLSQDCTICTRPLALTPPHTAHPTKSHRAVRIVACGHIHGLECLSAWLDVGNSCPTCKRMLFSASGNAITDQDVADVLEILGPRYGQRRVLAAVARIVAKGEVEGERLRHLGELERERLRVQDGRVKSAGFTLSGEDFLESGDEMGWDGEDDDDDDEGDFGVMDVEEDDRK